MSQEFIGQNNTYSDEELVEKSLSDNNFFALLISRYKEKFFYYLKRFTGFDSDEVEDVVQNSFIKIYINLNNFNKDLKFSSWAYRIVHNEAIDEIRRKKRGSLPLFSDFDIPSDFDLLENIDGKIEKEKVALVLKEVKEEYREILILRFFEHKDYKEISDILKKPMGTISTMINRAKKQFKTKYEKYVK